jgi:transcriptional regulator with XRE-family HTH domain
VTAQESAKRLARGARIRQALAQAELSQADAARSLGISTPVLSRVITGERMRRDLWPRLAALTGVRSAWLADGEEPVHDGLRPRVQDAPAPTGAALPALPVDTVLREADRIREAWEVPPAVARRLAEALLPAGHAVRTGQGRLVLVVLGP